MYYHDKVGYSSNNSSAKGKGYDKVRWQEMKLLVMSEGQCHT